MKYATLYLMVRVLVQSEHENVSETQTEVEQGICSISDTGKVRVLETEILLTRVRNIKIYRNGNSD
ncbi:hypothetical protein [Parapedobacter defluvii]|uniref:hypothetical protein n=1 Tax=Parapedobacter defluvii TaxID=2045106 RepID=UPI001662A6C9|nr:hypothetical protein [Parapedobacter defluvii]